MVETPKINHEIFGTVTDVYWWNIRSTKFFRVNQGGTSSSKTYSIMQAICEELMKRRRSALITGSQHHTLESGPKADLKEIILNSPVLQDALSNPDAEGSTYRFKNGSRMVFKAYDTPAKAKAGKRDITFINEANNISYEIARQLIMRTRDHVYIDYNSDARFWVHEQIVEGEAHRADYFISNFTHNPHITEQTMETLKSTYTRWKETGSDYWRNQWRVFGLGLTGSIAGTIFAHNFYTIKSFDAIEGLRRRAYALDFGYTNDPTALIECGTKFGNFYGKQIIYETGLYGSKLAQKMRNELKLDQSIPVICDNDKASIQALQQHGFMAIQAKKPPIVERIAMMQDSRMYVQEDSYDWRHEQQNYKFKINKITQEYTNEPARGYDHCFDAAGYYMVWTGDYTVLNEKRVGRRLVIG